MPSRDRLRGRLDIGFQLVQIINFPVLPGLPKSFSINKIAYRYTKTSPGPNPGFTRNRRPASQLARQSAGQLVQIINFLVVPGLLKLLSIQKTPLQIHQKLLQAESWLHQGSPTSQPASQPASWPTSQSKSLIV